MAATVSLSRFCAGLSVQQALHPENKQLSVLRKEDEANYLKVIALLIARARELLNIKPDNSLSVMQTVDLAFRIGKEYYYLRLEEILYVIQAATSGRYGKDYNRLDAATVMGWLEKYDVEERTPLAVMMQQQQRISEENQPLNDVELAKFYQRVADGVKTDTAQTPRMADADRMAQDEARKRYISEKGAGVIKTWSPEDLQRAMARAHVDEYVRNSDAHTVQRLEDTDYQDVTHQPDAE